MKPLRVGQAVIAGVCALTATGIVMQLIRNSGASLPSHSWWECLIVATLAGALLAAGWRVRSYVEGLKQAQRDREALVASGEDASRARVAAGPLPVAAPDADFARRVAVCAQAAALGGAVLVGWYLAQGIVQLQRWETSSGRSAVITLAVLAGCAIALSSIGFRVQSWCMVPPGSSDARER